MRYCPVASVIASWTRLVSRLVALTRTPCITADEGSVATPRIDPVTSPYRPNGNINATDPISSQDFNVLNIFLLLPLHWQQRHHRPVARCGRAELIVTVGKVTIEVRLEGWRSGPDQPRPVFHLRVEKISQSVVALRPWLQGPTTYSAEKST